jgi:hypothetical protein
VLVTARSDECLLDRFFDDLHRSKRSSEDSGMSGAILTANVKDATKWEKSFRGHTDLFRRNNISLINYTITKDNDVVMYSETNDVESYMSFVQSPVVAKAMEEDGVDRSSVKVYPLDKQLNPS